MEIGNVFSWIGTVARLIPMGRSLLRLFRNLTVTCTYIELGIIATAIVVGVAAGLLTAGLHLFTGFFVCPLITITVYIGGVKFIRKTKVVYHPEGYLTVEKREEYFCHKCWDERKELVPMKQTIIQLPSKDGHFQKLKLVCAKCGDKIFLNPGEFDK